MSAPQIFLDDTSSEPPYEQVRNQISALVLKGLLVAGDRLPSVRQLAGDLGLATGTVARAYRELDADGVTRGRGARGTTIVGPPSNPSRSQLVEAAARYADEAVRRGHGIDDALAALRIAFAAMKAI